ncbi:hypothetical protein GobsT_41060 [Gemmata obscuriglobus]|nr:hypothetical protein GobsT_41060 [Gemmata obscuriglobus]VTS08295.1 ---NA--- : [Gemmata obscuriglobus UQM 2246]
MTSVTALREFLEKTGLSVEDDDEEFHDFYYPPPLPIPLSVHTFAAKHYR